MILDGTLAMTADDKDILNPARKSLLDDVLDGGFVHNGQHFLRGCLGRGKKTCPIPCRRNDRFAYMLLFHIMLQSIM